MRPLVPLLLVFLLWLLLVSGLACAQGCERPAPEPASLLLDLDQDGLIDPGKGDRILSYAASGSGLTASDVSDPANPVVLWRIVAAGASGGDFAGLGPQWSAPRIATLNLANNGGEPRLRLALLFGGGYGGGRGAALFVVRADSGALIWKGTHPDLREGIAAAPALLDSDGDGAVDRLVVGDTGGKVWRADLAGPPSRWKLTHLADLAGRFFSTPDLVQEHDAGGRYDAVVIGSGDREHPLDTAARDSVFLIKDRNLAPGSGVDRAAPPEGWRLALQAGEKAFSSPITVAHTIYLATYVPPSDPAQGCVEGRGVVRAIGLASGAARTDFLFFELIAHGLPAPVIYAGHAKRATSRETSCTVRLLAGTQAFEVPGCSRFRTFWQRIGG